MPTPSLLIVPARFKTGRLYSQIPTANGDFTVTRATAATRVNASGLIESVASGIPRLDYFASGGVVGCPALLVEPSGQNLAWNSETWASGSNWRADVSGNITTVTGAIAAPDGTTTANAISPTSGNAFHGAASLGVTYASGTNYTMSAFFKAGTGAAGRYVQLTFTALMNTGAGYANYDLQNGIVTASGGTGNVAASIQNYGNGWYRCIYTALCNTSVANALGFICNLIPASGSTRSQTFSGTVTDVLYGWGAQLETGSVATSYIPTTTGQVTRNADVISVSGAVSGSIGQTEGTIYAEVDVRLLGAAGRVIVDLTNRGGQASGTIDSRVLLQFSSASGNTLTALVVSGGTTVFTLANTIASAGIVKVAFGYKTGDSAFYVNGVSGGVSTSAFTFSATMNEANLGSARSVVSGLGINIFNDRIRAAALYTTRLTDAQLAALTSP